LAESPFKGDIEGTMAASQEAQAQLAAIGG
jgi:hypothetical protein